MCGKETRNHIVSLFGLYIRKEIRKTHTLLVNSCGITPFFPCTLYGCVHVYDKEREEGGIICTVYIK